MSGRTEIFKIIIVIVLCILFASDARGSDRTIILTSHGHHPTLSAPLPFGKWPIRFLFEINGFDIIPYTGELKLDQEIYAEIRVSNGIHEVLNIYKERPESIDPANFLLLGKISLLRPYRGQPVGDLTDVSRSGWLSTQSSTEPWRIEREVYDPIRHRWEGPGPKGLWWLGQSVEPGTTIFFSITPSSHYDSSSLSLDTLNVRKDDFIVIKGIAGPIVEGAYVHILYGFEYVDTKKEKAVFSERPFDLKIDLWNFEVKISESGRAKLINVWPHNDSSTSQRNFEQIFRNNQ